MKRNNIYILLSLIVFSYTASCTILRVGLSQDLINKYMVTYSRLQEANITIQKDTALQSSQEAYNKATIITHQSGFRNYLHFLRVHTKIMKGLLVLDSQREINKVVGQYAPDLEDWQKKLDDPHITDEKKKEIRQRLSRLIEQYRKNEEYNDPVKILSRWVISQEALILIEKNEKVLRDTISSKDLDAILSD